MMMVRALYGLKMSGASWRSVFKEFIENNLHFKSTQNDPDMYIIRNRWGNGTEYFEVLLVYVNDVLADSHSLESTMKDISL